ncbi:MAG TPA: hypothetical protein VHC98_03330 [Candidatus Saccharimonadales bacterium]|nr:hypothetical protein [Candidatus Saccharimonadales bacterium]
MLISLGGYHIWSSHASHSTGSATGASTNGQPPKLTKGTPPYHTMLPAGKTIEQLGGWTRISPPDRDPAYAYVDHIGAVQVDVSEQPLPANFEHDTASQIAQLAAGFNATDTLTAGSLVAYIGTSAKGPQSVIFAKGNLLILIKSGAVVPNDQWAAYLESLR